MTKKHSECLYKVFFDLWFKQTFILAPFLFTVIFVAYNAEMGGKSQNENSEKHEFDFVWNLFAGILTRLKSSLTQNFHPL
jgi:hypothetical protein